MIVGVIGAVVPDGSGDGLKKYVSFIGALCVLCVLISPLGGVVDFVGRLGDGGFDGFFDSLSDKGKYEQRYSDYLMSLGRDNISEGVRSLLSEKFGIPSDECRVSVKTREHDGTLAVESVTVILSGRSLFCDPYEIEEYISGLLNCKCTVAG